MTVAAVAVVLLPFFGGAPGISALADTGGDVSGIAARSAHQAAAAASGPIATAYTTRIDEAALAARAAAELTITDREHLAQKPAGTRLAPVGTAGIASGTLERRAALAAEGLSCPTEIGGTTNDAPSIWSELGVGGTTSDDLALFARTFNSIRVDNCLAPIPLANFTYDSCMEQRLIWMAEDPSTDPMSAWGHIGSVRSDGLSSVGCDGNLAGGTGNTAGTAAYKWWESDDHRASLYRPGTDTTGVCIAFAMSHGGVPNEPYPFTRAAARWYDC
jgi:hypothetical protein